ncbi:hypothetical protein [Acaryochloris marina]|uniref:hypothetical protein n=1 Tax=Acaryochloris marina TaxID=155978 RepID=UPI001BAFB89E|nr:hypothetical protein [Acaryochloris marina]QUY45780.1 hypothetical protein I1H34_28965 [Acaryochloris marina S15]
MTVALLTPEQRYAALYPSTVKFDITIDFYPGVEEDGEELDLSIELPSQAHVTSRQQCERWVVENYPSGRLISVQPIFTTQQLLAEDEF